MLYVVLGMHKSGTTLVAQVLHHSGIAMLDEGQIPSSYDRGFQYERRRIRDLNERILRCRGRHSLRIRPTEQARLSDAQQTELRQIITTAGNEAWGFKDPRSCLTYHLLAPLLPPHRIVAIYRPIEELWLRYRSHTWRGRPKNPAFALQLTKRWLEHNQRLIDILCGTCQPYVLLEYGRMMTGSEELSRLQEFVGHPLSDERREDLYRSKPRRRSALLASARWIVKRAGGRDAESVFEQLEALRTGSLGGERPDPSRPGSA